MILIGFTCTGTFQLWLICAQNFAKEVEGWADPSIMQTYYSVGTMLALIVTALVMIASSLCNYTILTAASYMTPSGVMTMNIILPLIGVLLGIFVNLRYTKMMELASGE